MVVLCLLITLAGCGNRQSQQALFDRTYASSCDVVKDLTAFALKNHAIWHPGDLTKLSNRALQSFQASLKIAPEPSGDLCSSLRTLYEQQKSKVKSEVDFYRLYLKIYMRMLDPHSAYISPEEVQHFKDQSDGKGESSGIEFYYRNSDIMRYSKDNALWVDYLHDDTYPTLKIGDLIKTIFDQSIQPFSMEDFSQLIKDKTELVLTTADTQVLVDRYHAIYPRFYIKTFDVDDRSVAWVRLTDFTKGVAEQLIEALQALTEVDALVFDLRGNPGGYLVEVDELLDYFLPPMHVYSEVSYRKGWARKTRLKKPQSNELPLTILIDSGSASASEIFAGVIKMAGRGTLIGNLSFGKMTAQRPYLIGDKNGMGGMFKLTESIIIFADQSTAQFHRLIPDVLFEDPEAAILQSKKGMFYEFQQPRAIKPGERAPSWNSDHRKQIDPCQADQLQTCWHQRISKFVIEQLD